MPRSSRLQSGALSEERATVAYRSKFQEPDQGDHMASYENSTQSSIGFGTAVRLAYANYARGAGRATRAEYWWFYLFTMVVGFPVNIIVFAVSYANAGSGSGAASVLWLVEIAAFAIPSITLTVRRLHDTNKSAHYLWFVLLPFAGAVVLFILMLLPSDPGANRYGAAH